MIKGCNHISLSIHDDGWYISCNDCDMFWIGLHPWMKQQIKNDVFNQTSKNIREDPDMTIMKYVQADERKNY